jgi:ubiquinone/menaquinone biosynthesis C-methylase UbiE
MKGKELNEVHAFWNSESCGERYAFGEDDKQKFLSETRKRYELEPYIKSFAEFEKFRGLDVLDIGVGFGSDHSQIAEQSPKTLTGIDLTERAIENTKTRFKTLGLTSLLQTDNAEALSFESNIFDAVYSWGVLHHSPNTEKCFEEVFRVLRPNGFAKIMVYHKNAPTGWMLWVKYALLRGRPLRGLSEIYSEYLESPGTKSFTVLEAKNLTKMFSKSEISVQLSFGDLLEGDVGVRHKGLMLSIAKALYPRSLIKGLAKVFPIGLCLMITVHK